MIAGGKKMSDISVIAYGVAAGQIIAFGVIAGSVSFGVLLQMIVSRIFRKG
jgi:hypothetical protein